MTDFSNVYMPFPSSHIEMGMGRATVNILTELILFPQSPYTIFSPFSDALINTFAF